MRAKEIVILIFYVTAFASCLNTQRMVSKRQLSNVYDSLKILTPFVFVNKLNKGEHYSPKDPSNLLKDLNLQEDIKQEVFNPLVLEFCKKEKKRFVKIDSTEAKLLRCLLYNDLKRIDKKRKLKRTLLFFIFDDRFHRLYQDMFALQLTDSEICTKKQLDQLSQKFDIERLLFINIFYIHNDKLGVNLLALNPTEQDMLPNEVISAGVLNLKTQKIEYLLSQETSNHPSYSYSNKDKYTDFLNKLKDKLEKF